MVTMMLCDAVLGLIHKLPLQVSHMVDGTYALYLIDAWA